MSPKQSSEPFLSAILNTVVDGIIAIDSRGIIQSVNRAAEEMFGYRADQMLGNNVAMLMDMEHAEAHDGYIDHYLTTGETHIIGMGREVMAKRKDGTMFPIELAVSEYGDGDERLFVGVLRDISDRQKALEQLKLQSAALDSAANAVVITDADGNISWVNSAFTRLTGYDYDEVIGKNPRILKSGDQSSEEYQALWEAVLAGRIWHGELVNRRKDGSDYIEEQTITPVRGSDGRISHFVAIKQDISERKAAEQALDEKNRVLQERAKFDRSQGKVMELFSRSYEQKEILADTLSIIAEHHDIVSSAIYLYEEWSGQLKCIASHGAPSGIKMAVAPGEGVIGQAARERRTLELGSDQAPIRINAGLFEIAPSSVIATPIVYQEKVLGVMVLAPVAVLLAEEKRFIERVCDQIGVGLNNIKQYHDLKALSDQLKIRGREIANKNMQLEEANRLKSEFLANMSHELRTPLNAIIGFSEVLKDGLLGEMPEEQLDYISDIFDSANHLLSLINDILDLSKIEAGKMELHAEQINIPELLRNSLSIVKEKAHAHRIQLGVEIADDVDVLIADARKFKQIIYNLVSNAVKFTPEGGKVTLHAVRDGDRIRITVEDTGIGIAPDQLSKLFRPFEQLDGSLSRRYEGTGLGLAMVKRLAELHGGSVSVESELEVGSRFTVEVPVGNPDVDDSASVMDEPRRAPVAPREQSSKPAHSLVTTSGSRALVVEGNVGAAQRMKRYLEGAGCEVEVASDAADALRQIAVQRPDLMVVDLELPDRTGWELMSEIQSDPDTADLPVVMVSLDNDDGPISLGSLNVLEKPVRKEVLFEVLQRHAETHGEAGKVLVVDDDASAREFVTTQLSSKGYEVAEAPGGREALELIHNWLPDLVILDLMMPEVTGFDVLSNLRADPKTADIPVVILTAKVLTAEDRAMLSGHLAEVVEKRDFDPATFMHEVRQALGNQPKRRSSRPLVLVVEDNDEQARLIQLYLEDMGFDIVRAANGNEALECMKQAVPALITLDLLMPEMDGFAFMEEKSQHPEWVGIPVVVMSAISDQLNGQPISASAVLRKPIQRSELVDTLTSILPSFDEERPKILVVDDDPKAVKVISTYLPDEQFEVITAFGGRDGLDAVRFEKPNLIILDLMMPDMSGFEVLQELRSNPATAEIPVIVLTAKILTDDEQQLLKKQVAMVAEKGRADREMVLKEVQRIFTRYRP